MPDLRQTPRYAKYMEAIGWKTEKINNTYAFIKKVPVFGNFIKIQRPEKFSNNQTDLLKTKYKPFLIVVEPKDHKQEQIVKSKKFTLSKSFYVPSKTVQIDLLKSEKQLLKEMHYKTRYNIKKSQSLRLKTEISKDINFFADFWQKCSFHQRGMYISQKKEIKGLYNSFGKDAYLISTEKDNRILSSVLLIKAGKTAYYMYAASTAYGKNLFAPTLNVWEAIKISKNRGCTVFDFEGIFDERFPLPSWKGFTRFKKSFGGKEIGYPGTYKKSYSPLANLFSI